MKTSRNLLLGMLGALVLIALLAVVLISENQRMDRAEAQQQGQFIAQGGRLYDQYCSGCHGQRGEGLAGIYPALNVENMLANRPDLGFYGTVHDYISLSISAGHPNSQMPSWSEQYGGPLRADQIEAITQFVLNWQGQQPPGVRPEGTPAAGVTGSPPAPTPAGTQAPVAEGDPAAGEEVFVVNCQVCHGEGAQGTDIGPSLVRPDLESQPDEFFSDVIHNGRPGTAMPAWGGRLSEQQIADVIAYIRVRQQAQ